MTNIFENATTETPVFAKINLYSTPKAYRYSDEKPYVTDMVVAITKVVEEDWIYYVKMCVLYGGTYTGGKTSAPKFGDYLTQDYNDFDFVDIMPTSDELNSRYQEFRELHKNAPYKVIARKYSEVTNSSKFAKSIGKEQIWHLGDAVLGDGTKINSLNDAIKWVLENHPSYIQGMCIAQDCPSGNLYCASVPCDEYGIGFYETYENRYNYAKNWADDLGVVVGAREF